MSKILDGKAIAAAMRDEIAAGTAAFEKEAGFKPGLTTVLVGNDPASEVYVRMKGRAAEQVGMASRQIVLPGDASEDEVLGVVDGLNADPTVHGILVQLPLPRQIDATRVVRRISPAKDVDGLHPTNMGRLAMGDPDVLAPCTPAGVVEMLLRSGHDPGRRHVVVVGRSNLVGRPLALLLLRDAPGGNATVTVAHSRTHDLPSITRTADILVAAVGRPGLITRDAVRPGAVVIDVAPIASAITPVPGGVGPMTITLLLRNTLEAARRQFAAGGAATTT